MKTISKCIIIITLAYLLSSTSVSAQAPNSFKYQAMLRDASGNIKANTSANILIDILQGSATGTNVFAESFTAQTNSFGLINLEIGKGTLVSGNITTIDWSAGSYFIKISVDGVEMGASQLLSVPYAKYAENAGNATTAGNVKWNANGKHIYYNSGRVGIGTSSPSARLHVADSAVVFTGPIVLSTATTFADLPVQGDGARMMWLPDKAAFKVGMSESSNIYKCWDKDSIGLYSFGAGVNAKAKGIYSVAIGRYAYATNAYSTAIGYSAMSHGEGSTAMGFGIAKGYSSVAMGYNSTAQAKYSIAMGGYNLAAGDYSVCFGAHNTANAYETFAIGQYSPAIGTKDSWVATDPLFVAGNGTSSTNLTSALILYKNGNVTISGTFTQNSDIRLKENISSLSNTLGKISNIQPVYYEFKDKRAHPAGKHIGFIAQEVQKEFPELVSVDENGYLSVEYQNMTAVLLQSVKEQKTQIEAQQKQIDELKQLVDKLTKK